MNKNKKILKTITITATIGVLAITVINAYSDNPASAAVGAVAVIQPEFPQIVYQPEDQLLPFGSTATFKVTALNTSGYQWLLNGNPLDGQTNSDLIITNCGINDVGYYTCDLFKDIQAVPTRSASLMVYTNSIDPQTGVDPIVVFGLPVPGKGTQGTCPGKYVGYINYTKSATNGWGWVPDTSNSNTVFYATDTNRADTKVIFGGEYGDNGCNQTTITVPNPPISPVYRFTIYFTNNVPTNAYGITLDGFLP